MTSQSAIVLIGLLAGTAIFGVSLAHQYIALKAVTLFVLIGIGTFILAMPTRWSIRLLFAYIGFEGFAKIVSGYHPVIHVGVDLLILLLFAKTIFLLVLKKIDFDEKFPPLTPLFVLHFAWFIVSIFNPYAISIVASLAGAKVYVTVVMLYFFAYFLCKDSKETKIIMGIWITVTAIHATVSLYQSTIGWQSLLSLHSGYAPTIRKFQGQAFRPAGLTHLPGGPAVYIFLGSSMLMYFLFTCKSLLMKLVLGLQVPIWVVTLFICQVRSALLKSIVAGAIFVFFYFIAGAKGSSRTSLKHLAVGAMILLLGVFFIPQALEEAESSIPDAARAFERTFSVFDYDKVASARKNTLERLFNYASDAPIGAGFGRVGAAAGKFGNDVSHDDPFGPGYFFSDNFWIATVVDLGLPGMFLLTILIFLLIWLGFKNRNIFTDADEKLLNIALCAALFGSGIGMYGAEAMLYNPEAAFFWFFAGAMIRHQEQARQNLILHTNHQQIEYDNNDPLETYRHIS